MRKEVADWIDLTPAERWQLAKLWARDAAWVASASGRREQIAAVRADMDASYVRKWIVDMMGEDDDRVRRWDGSIATQRRP